jgi:hypothetical protein
MQVVFLDSTQNCSGVFHQKDGKTWDTWEQDNILSQPSADTTLHFVIKQVWLVEKAVCEYITYMHTYEAYIAYMLCFFPFTTHAVMQGSEPEFF